MIYVEHEVGAEKRILNGLFHELIKYDRLATKYSHYIFYLKVIYVGQGYTETEHTSYTFEPQGGLCSLDP